MNSPVASSSRSPQSLREGWVALVGLMAVFLFEMLDNSILNVALPTIGRDLNASATSLQWVVGAYAVVFGGLMLVFGALADRIGRRRVMTIGLVLLAIASLGTAFVHTAPELIAVRALMGVAAAMTTPGSMALAFRLFSQDSLRLRATNLIVTVGLIGLAVGPAAGGFVLAFAPWQVLLLVNVPIALLALIAIRRGIAPDDSAELHRDPIDVTGALLGTAAIGLALIAPTFFVNEGIHSWTPWLLVIGAAIAIVGFIIREKTAKYPLIQLDLVARPLVASGLGYQSAVGLAAAGFGYIVTLQLQLDWGWAPALAAAGMLPQMATMLAISPVLNRFVEKLGFTRAAWIGATAVVVGLAGYAILSRFGYIWVAIAMVLMAAGMRVVGVVASVNVLRGLPKDRTSIGAAVNDTATEVTSAIGIAVGGSILAAMFAGSITAPNWTTAQHGEFQTAVMVAGLVLTIVAAGLVIAAYLRSRHAVADPDAMSVEEALEEA